MIELTIRAAFLAAGFVLWKHAYETWTLQGQAEVLRAVPKAWFWVGKALAVLLAAIGTLVIGLGIFG